MVGLALGLTVNGWSKIVGQLSFSTDGGKTFSAETPVIPEGGSVAVRVDWMIKDEAVGEVESNLIHTQLGSFRGDFGSANRGQQNWGGRIGWYQQPAKSWFNADRDQSVTYTLNLGARSEGMSGNYNVWNKEAEKYESGPLPAVKALPVGDYSFFFSLYYRKKDGGALVRAELPFSVKVGKPIAPSKRATEAGRELARPSLPKIKGDIILPAKEWEIYRGSGELRQKGAFVIPEGTQEIAMSLNNTSTGKYYIRALVETGRGSGEDDLRLAKPFFYLNGKPIDFSRATAPGWSEGALFTVIESREPVSISPGDSLRWNASDRPGRMVGALALSTTPLVDAPLDVMRVYDPAEQDSFRLIGSFSLNSDKNSKVNEGLFKLECENVAGRASDFKVSIELRDYWQNSLSTHEESLTIPDRKTALLKVPFVWNNSDRVRAIVKVSGPGQVTQDYVFEELLNISGGMRPKMWLDKEWEWISIPDDGTLASRDIGELAKVEYLKDWQKTDLPASWQDTKPKDYVAWYRKSIELPQWLRQGRVILNVSRISYEGELYLNGKKIGSSFGPPVPVKVDITDTLKPGANEFVLGIRGGIAALEESEWKHPQIDLSSKAKYRSPEPLKGGIGEVTLLGTPPLAIEDVFVKTSYRTKMLSVDVELPASDKDLIVSNKVFHLGKEVFSLPERRVKPNDNRTVQFSGTWENPILWNPNEPNLLQLTTTMSNLEGEIVDRKDTRFGFREVWADGDSLVWNGTRMKFSGIPFLYGWGWDLSRRSKRDALRNYALLTKRMGGVMQRHIYDPAAHADISDEEGIPMAQGTGGVVSPTKHKVDSDSYWKHAGEFVEGMVKDLRNHPSIVEWYLSNEFFAADEDENRDRLVQLGKNALSMDTSRILEFGCDLDLGGFSPVISTHYPVDVRALREEKAFFPDGAYWRYLNETFHVGDRVPKGLVRTVANVRGESRLTWGEKPIVINETLWDYFLNPPDGLTRLVGDSPYRGVPALEQSLKAANAWFVQGHRDAEASVITPWEWIYRDPIGTVLPPVDINPIQRYRSFYSGARIPFDVNLHWDFPRSAKLSFLWDLKTANGDIVESGKRTLDFGPAELKREKIEITLPKVSKPQKYTLYFELVEGDSIVKKVDQPVFVAPRQPSFKSTRRIRLFDPAGSTREKLAQVLGTSIELVDSISDKALENIDILVIGEEGGSTSDSEAQQSIKRFLERGGRVLVLAQRERPRILPFKLTPTGLVSSQLWTFYPENPLLKDLDPDQLAYWYPEHKLGSHLYLKPESGNYRSLLESGGPNGLVYSAALERFYGSGKVLCLQIDVLDKPDDNPVGRQLLDNSLRYLETTASMSGKLGVVAGKDSKILKKLRSLGVDFSMVESFDSLEKWSVLLVDAAEPLLSDVLEKMQEYARRGGWLWIQGITPDNAHLLSGLGGGDAKVVSPGWNARAIRLGTTDQTAGLTNYDLFWKRRLYNTLETPFYDNTLNVGDVGTAAIELEHGQPLLYPAFLGTMRMGKGGLLWDNLNWTSQSFLTGTYSDRLASLLLTNFRIPMQSDKTLEIPENLEYTPVKLAGLLNRKFADDVAEDGKGGWTDQGPKADLSGFATASGIRYFSGIPYLIEAPHGALVLASPKTVGKLPEKVELPVNGNVDVLFFLQSSAWTSEKHHASYVVNYEDGSTYEVRLIGGVNLRDWTSHEPDAPFPYEKDTFTEVAWTGSSPDFEKVSLFQMAWLNPHPERAIKNVTFESRMAGVPVLVAVTKGIRKGGLGDAGSGDISARNPEQAKTLLSTARSLVAGKNREQARKSLASATKADPLLAEAWFELAALEEEEGEPMAAIRTYEAMIKALPDNLEALFRLAAAYESQSQWDDAEKIYNRSLEINRNQPEVLKALNALQNKKVQ